MWHRLPDAWPVTQRAASPGLHVTPQEPQGPIAGALHEAPASTFCFTSFSFFFFLGASDANAGLNARHAATAIAAILAARARFSLLIIVASRSGSDALSWTLWIRARFQ
jgi:hypothetical protein